jgi:histidine triad (HIT) family protein
MADCLFCNIIAGKIPSRKVYEDERTFAFEDLRPQAPTHVLIIPRKHIVDIKEASEADAEIIGYCHLVAAKIAKERGIERGYRTVYNVGPDSGQSVFHLHLHLGTRLAGEFFAVIGLFPSDAQDKEKSRCADQP